MHYISGFSLFISPRQTERAEANFRWGTQENTRKLFLQITCWSSSDNSLSPNYTKNGCPGMPRHPLGMPNKVRELQLSNGLQPRTAAQFANEPQILE